jgi:hypothetical protein
MTVEIGTKVVTLRDAAAVGRDPLEAGEIVKVVATKLLSDGCFQATVCREGEARHHFVHSSDIVPLESDPVDKMSVTEMVDRFFQVERATVYVRSNTLEYVALDGEHDQLFEAIPNTPSRTYKDLESKLRFAADYARGCADSHGETCPFLTDFLDALGRDHVQLMDRLDEEAA